ncbi:transforming growth factor beta regulator 1 isoform X2 [Anoplophora glabripennis]|uniref:transforming growth factor beta regulator 1 isoform X2 n=1 Tax=Anoplophora glabripennis TaxID=217634 RepID=UPI00087436A4|nr:transforming growth factor beta regulator 1 isoform X2 [Anoplophora glabripennis]
MIFCLIQYPIIYFVPVPVQFVVQCSVQLFLDTNFVIFVYIHKLGYLGYNTDLSTVYIYQDQYLSFCMCEKMAYNYNMRLMQRNEKSPGKYKQKLLLLKQMIREYVHENAALVDELEEVQINIIIRKEERKFLLRKLCEYEPQIALEVQNTAKDGPLSRTNNIDSKKTKKKLHLESIERRSSLMKSRKNPSKNKKKIVQPIPVDNNGRPIFPIELGRLTVHSLGEVVSDRMEFHSEDAIYPVGYVSTRFYGSLKDPTQKCMYTCKISDVNDSPRFEIASDDNCPPIIGDTPDVCHSLLLQKINDALSLHVVSTRPHGNDFFGLTHPIVLHLLQSSPGTRKCIYYKWTKFEVSKNAEPCSEDNDAGLSYEHLQRCISFCKYKMAPDVLQKPDEYGDGKDSGHMF